MRSSLPRPRLKVLSQEGKYLSTISTKPWSRNLSRGLRRWRSVLVQSSRKKRGAAVLSANCLVIKSPPITRSLTSPRETPSSFSLPWGSLCSFLPFFWNSLSMLSSTTSLHHKRTLLSSGRGLSRTSGLRFTLCSFLWFLSFWLVWLSVSPPRWGTRFNQLRASKP